MTTLRAVVSRCVARRLAACALPRPSATDSARVANSTVSHSHTVMDQANTLGSSDGEHRGERGADLDDEHDGGVPQPARVEPAQRAGQGGGELPG